MLNPDILVNAVVTALNSIPDFVTAMTSANGNVSITAYTAATDDQPSLDAAIYEMTAPSTLVAWDRIVPGNFDGTTIWKHMLQVVVRAPIVANAPTPITFGTLAKLIVDSPINGTSLNIRQQAIIPEVDLVDTPPIQRLKDETGKDFIVIHLLFPEIGDNN